MAQENYNMPASNKESETKERVYFPNLNGLRFIAAFMVIIHHVEQIKSIYGIKNFWGSPFIRIIGEQGVVLFFVLSGFLITYLMLEEEKVTGSIHVGNFYLRRILRIWPLYFFIILIALWILPHISLFTLPGYEMDMVYRHLPTKIILYLFFLPNLVSALAGIVPYAAQTWSIGTEEQFYLVWPLIMKHIKKHRIALMLIIIFGYIFVARALYSSRSDFLPFKEYINTFWLVFNIDCMAIGGLLAIILYTRNKSLKFLMNNLIFYSAIILVSYFLSKGFYVPHIYKEFYAVFFGIIILNFAANPNIHINLETRVFKYLGKISYGLYMYHPIGVVLAVNLAIQMKIATNMVIYPLSVAFAIIFAALSYKYFESFFLKFKMNYSTITSGDDISTDGKQKRLLKEPVLK